MPTNNPILLKALYRAMCRLNEASSLDDVLKVTVDSAVQLVNAERGFILRRPAWHSSDWSVMAAHNPDQPASEQYESNPLVQKVMKSGQSLLADSDQDSEFRAWLESTGQTPSKTAVIVPLKLVEQITSIVYVERIKNGEPFTTDQFNLLETFSQQAGLAIHKMELARRYEEILPNFSHEFQTPVHIILCYIELLLAGKAGALNEEQINWLAIIHQKTHSLTDLRDILVGFFQIDPRRLALAPVNALAVLERVLSDLQTHVKAKQLNVVVEFPPLPAVLVDEYRGLHLILATLLEIAVHNTPDEGMIMVTAAEQDAVARFAITDSGAGMTAEEQAEIFRFGWDRLRQRTRKRPRIGTDPALIRQLVEYFGGKIGVESVVGKGCTFWFTLPIATENE